MKDWQSLEENVKQYAGYIWNRVASTERIGGVNYDCVLKISEEEYVIIEITQQNNLEKIRADCAKFNSNRFDMAAKGIVTRSFIICDFKPTPGMQDAGKANKVNVLSFEEFRNRFFNFTSYAYIRQSKQFGSAIDPETGENDQTVYTPVGYELDGNGEIKAQDIAQRIIDNKKVVLLGDYGTGKSRCFREVFRILSERSEDTMLYPIAIDLKETWGLENAVEIIRRHFNKLGVGESDTNNVIKAHNSKRLCFLLDGFDEIGSRPWSDNKETLERLRKHALQGVKDLISQSGGGCLISGRDHYFNSDKEMFSALGINPKSAVLARCKNEFNYDEFNEYLKANKIQIQLPDWLPKKPLVLKMISSLDQQNIQKLFGNADENEIEFWFKFIDAMCERDSKIHAILDPETVKEVLIQLASLTRDKHLNMGPISAQDIVDVFHRVTHSYPDEQSTVMLQRLPGLGRVNAETSDRNFVDTFILDGLRALDLSQKVQLKEKEFIDQDWLNPLQHLGSSILAQQIQHYNLTNVFISHVKQALRMNRTNKVATSDIISAISKTNITNVDYEGVIFTEPHFGQISFDKNNITNIQFVDGIFESVELGKLTPNQVSLEKCTIQKLQGVSSKKGLPGWIHKNCEILSYESVDTLTAMKDSGLNNAQTILVSILIKVYRQAGNGRLEHTLTKGLTHVDNKSLKQVLRYLVQNDVLLTSKDKGEIIYKPDRKLQTRVEKIIEELDRSNDAIWQFASQLG